MNHYFAYTFGGNLQTPEFNIIHIRADDFK